MRVIKSKGTVTLPSYPSGGSITKWARETMTTLQQLRDRVTVIPPIQPNRDTLPHLYVSYFYDATATAWKYQVTAGYATSQNIDGGVLYHTPTLGGTSLEADPRPSGTLPANNCFIYLKILTTNKGVVTGTPTIESSTSEQTDQHHVPPDATDPSGTTGIYYWMIAEFEDDGGTPGKPQIARRSWGNKNVPNQLVELENIGTGAKVAKDYDPDTDQHKIRTLVERASSPQISVTERTDDILIDGNNYDNAGSGFATAQSVSDGLVTIFTDLAFGADGSFTCQDACGLGYYTITVSKGLITNIAFTSF